MRSGTGQGMVKQETDVLHQVMALKQLMTKTEPEKRSVINLVFEPSTTDIKNKGTYFNKYPPPLAKK